MVILDQATRNKLLSSGTYDHEKFFWLDKLSGEGALAALIPDNRRAEMGSEMEEYAFTLKGAVYKRLQEITKGDELLTYIFVLASVSFVLHKHTGNMDVMLGTPIFKNDLEAGVLNRALVMRTSIADSSSFRTYVAHVRETVMQAMNNQNYPVELLAEELGWETDDQGYPVFPVLLTLENMQHPAYAESLSTHLEIRLTAEASSLQGKIKYRKDVYWEQTAVRLSGHIGNVLERVVANPNVSLAELSILDEHEQQTLIYDWNATEEPYSQNVLMHQLFERQAKLNPEHPALVFDGQSMTYGELERRANQLAAFLRERGITAGTPVGVLLPRSFDMVIAVFGILKAGGAYIPMEPGFPAARVEASLNGVGVRCLLTHTSAFHTYREMEWTWAQLTDIVFLDVEKPHLPIEEIRQTEVVALWDYIAETAIDRVSAGGFVSAYTGQPFHNHEVDEYSRHVASLVQPYVGSDKTVMEIGCGAGLILEELAPHVGRYIGLDPSEATQQRNRSEMANKGWDHVQLISGFAHESDKWPIDPVDAVIIASTVQFFPGYRYLEHIVREAMNRLSDDGVLIIADVMDESRKAEFRDSIDRFRQENGLSPAAHDDDKLYCHENFFRYLEGTVEQIGKLEIIHRKDGFDNELKYRYDVVIRKQAASKQISATAKQSSFQRGNWTLWHVEQHDSKSLAAISSPDDIAYVIFTSGSTGTPKGVIVRHRSAVNVIEWVNRTHGIGSSDCLLFVTSLCFDLSVYDVFGMLAAGGTVRIAKESEIRDPERLLDIMTDEPITFWDSAPAALQQLAAFMPRRAERLAHSPLRLVFLSGDWIPLTLPDALKQHFPHVQVVSLGGATEATVWSNYYPVKQVDPRWVSIPYGYPIQNAKYYILDAYLQPCPLGASGELFIGGDCLASGYHDAALTVERFVPDPFSDKPGARMYRTGDLARWTHEGHMEFLGRVDHQVKIRGYRIEPGEIQACLLKHSAVREALVIDRTDSSGDKYLCAYVVADRETSIADIRDYLARSLPSYMVPQSFVRLEAIPVTANGKVDRKALPEPAGTGIVSLAEKTPLVTATEQRIAVVWQELLGITDIGADDNFFELGGHSLRATALVSKLNKQFGVDLPLREVFASPTVRALSSWIDNAPRTDNTVMILPVEDAPHYPVSSAQKRLFMLERLEGSGIGYNIPGAVRIRGALSRERTVEVLHALVRRHEAFRTTFDWINGDPVQIIHDEVQLELPVYDVKEEQLEERTRAFIQPFNLAQAPLLRACLFRIANDDHVLMFDMHHIISDGMSLAVLLHEFVRLYEGEQLPQLALRYRDYAVWQQSSLEHESIRRQSAYWLEQFADEIPLLQLPTDEPRPLMQNYDGARWEVYLEQSLSDRLHELSFATGTTLFMVLLSAYNVLLSKYTSQDDICVGTPVAGRTHTEMEALIGIFLNSVVIRSQLSPNMTFRELLQQVKDKAVQAFEHQQYPFEDLVEKANVRRDTGRNPLFDTMFILQNMDRSGLTIEGLHMDLQPITFPVSKFDLTLEALETDQGIELTWEYSTHLFRQNTITRMFAHYRHIVEAICANPDIPLHEIDLLSDEEQQLLASFNDTELSSQADEPETLLHEFERNVAKHPDRIALTFANESWTYAELNRKADALAAVLREYGVGPDRLVAVLTERSPAMLTALYAIWKAGGAYLPISPSNPKDRIEFMLQDSGAEVICTLPSYMENIDFQGTIVDLRELPEQTANSDAQVSTVKPHDLAYVIYTSGSTGKPKGVLVEHHSVANRIRWMQRAFPIGEEDVILQKTPFAFDVSVWELFWWGIAGARVHLLDPNGEKDPKIISGAVEKYKITTMHFVPSMLSAFLDQAGAIFDTRKLSSLRYVFTSGEALKATHVDRFRESIGVPWNVRLINLYGPTEATVDVTVFECNKESGNIVPIGKPIDRTRMYVMNGDGRIQPVGIWGELCIAGVGLARGYLNRPELTADKFVYMPQVSERIYKTGDLARWRSDGQLEYGGRIDHQVKIRGNRIECGEIEHVIAEWTGIREAVVMAKPDSNGELTLCAYYTADRNVPTGELKTYLIQRLPEYMIPSYIIQLELLPVTSNGKLDRAALPDPRGEVRSSVQYEAPANELEQQLTNIWSKLLNVERIGVNDDFFELGGHSLLAIRLEIEIEQIGLPVDHLHIFQHNTIRKIADQIQINLQQQEQSETP